MASNKIDELNIALRQLCPHRRIEFFERMINDCTAMETRFLSSLVDANLRREKMAITAISDELAPIMRNMGIMRSLGEGIHFDEKRRQLIAILCLLKNRDREASVVVVEAILKIPEALFKAVSTGSILSQLACHEILLIFSLAMCHSAFEASHKFSLFSAMENVYDLLAAGLDRCQQEICALPALDGFGQAEKLPIVLAPAPVNPFDPFATPYSIIHVPVQQSTTFPIMKPALLNFPQQTIAPSYFFVPVSNPNVQFVQPTHPHLVAMPQLPQPQLVPIAVFHSQPQILPPVTDENDMPQAPPFPGPFLVAPSDLSGKVGKSGRKYRKENAGSSRKGCSNSTDSDTSNSDSSRRQQKQETGSPTKQDQHAPCSHCGGQGFAKRNANSNSNNT